MSVDIFVVQVVERVKWVPQVHDGLKVILETEVWNKYVYGSWYARGSEVPPNILGTPKHLGTPNKGIGVGPPKFRSPQIFPK